MNRKGILSLTASTMVLGLMVSGCSGTSNGNVAKLSDQSPSRATGSQKDSAQARAAISKALGAGESARAVSLAETLVLSAPSDAENRAMLGQAYLANGRFQSAKTALGDAMQLGKDDPRTILSLALAQIATSDRQAAINLLDTNRERIPVSDYGLAMALAGEMDRALYVLDQAARGPDSNPRTRQNLAFALAMSGQWAQAKIIAMQDLSPADTEKRLTDWAEISSAEHGATKVAALIHAPVQNDPGQPVHLALHQQNAPQRFALQQTDNQPSAAQSSSTRQIEARAWQPSDGDLTAEARAGYADQVEAVAIPASHVAQSSAPAGRAAFAPSDNNHSSFAPAGPGTTAGPAAAPALARAAAQMPQSSSNSAYRDGRFIVEPNGRKSGTSAPARSVAYNQSAGNTPHQQRDGRFIIENRGATPNGNHDMGKPQQAVTMASASTDSAFGSRQESVKGWVIQLGEYKDGQAAKAAWNAMARKYEDLGLFAASTTVTTDKNGNEKASLTANGFGNELAANQFCEGLRDAGASCFVRHMDGNETVRWATRANQMMLASL